MTIAHVTENFAVSPQIYPDEVAALAAQGFVAVVCNRPDDEEPGQPAAAEIQAACDTAGIAFHHIPFASMPIQEALIEAMRKALADSDGPVIGYCRSGQRSQLIWAASA